MTTFKDLKIGDTFDFVTPGSFLNSFFDKCRKISRRKYETVDRPEKHNRTYQVGSIYADVYHINEERK